MHKLILNVINVCGCAKTLLKDPKALFKRGVGQIQTERFLIVTGRLYRRLFAAPRAR